MSERVRGKADTGVVSWRAFSDLYEHQSDFYRKLRFVIKIALVTKEKEIALDIIEDFLDQKESELEELRKIGLEEWNNAGRSKVIMLASPDRRLTRRASTDVEETELSFPKERKTDDSFWKRLRDKVKGIDFKDE